MCPFAQKGWVEVSTISLFHCRLMIFVQLTWFFFCSMIWKADGYQHQLYEGLEMVMGASEIVFAYHGTRRWTSLNIFRMGNWSQSNCFILSGWHMDLKLKTSHLCFKERGCSTRMELANMLRAMIWYHEWKHCWPPSSKAQSWGLLCNASMGISARCEQRVD